MRYIWPKRRNFVLDFKERGTGLCMLNEVWEKLENKKQQSKIEELLYMEDMFYISTPRPGTRRGGGAAIVADLAKFNLKKLNIAIPKPIEVVWGLLQPKSATGQIKSIIVISFYSPPNSKKNPLLLDHIATNLYSLKTKCPNPGIILAGDRNNLSIQKLLSIDLSLKQIVQSPTINQKVLDVILTNMHTLYSVPSIVQPIPVDIPGCGVPSDHLGVVANPMTDPGIPRRLPRTRKTVRPMPESLMNSFGLLLAQENWDMLSDTSLSTTELVSRFQDHVSTLISNHFPTKVVSASHEDKPWFTEELRILKRKRQRVYTKEGQTPKYLSIKLKFENDAKEAALKYTEKIQNEVLEGKRGSSYAALCKLGTNDSEASGTTFVLPNHVEENLTSQQSAERIASYFSSISQEYEPLQLDHLPPNIQIAMEIARKDAQPIVLTELDVYQKIKQARKPSSMIPGDIPVKLVKAFDVELAFPGMKLFNAIIKSLEYPSQWKLEHQVPIPKVPQPSDESQLRNIAKTAFLSKTFESFVCDWLLPFINPYLDPGQCGGLSKSSITHYLIKLLHFIHYNLDQTQPHAAILALVDMSKAFNRVSHAHVMQDLFDMHVPGWLLCIMASYLVERKMTLSFGGASSCPQPLPGGGPQGALLGNIVFIVKFNGAAMRPSIPRFVFSPTHRNQLTSRKSTEVKFVDDLSIGVSVNLKQELVKNPNFTLPPQYRERTGHILPATNSVMSEYLIELQHFSDQNLMRINHDKTKMMIFNTSRSYDCLPKFSFGIQESLEVIESTKLLGVILSTDLKWERNTEYICKKAMRKLWLLRKLKTINMDPLVIFDYYTKEIRSILELAAPVWHSGLTKAQEHSIERVQKIALSIILGDHYTNYDVACAILCAEPLNSRRDTLCINFAQKTASNSRHTDMFTRRPYTMGTRQAKIPYKEHRCHTKRFYNSPLPYLTRLLNSQVSN